MSEQENVGLEVIQSNSGTVTYADDVIATIAGLAAAEIEGVAGMSGGMVEGIGELLGRKNLTKGVRVEVGQQEAAVDLNLVVAYGSTIHQVCRDVQENVRKAIETMTGLKVVEVNVNVLGISVPKPEKEPKAIAPKEEPTAPRVK
ncbi:MAG: Asp23/Gls24 family envelope stress response protein [Christensenellales bacterium]|jgi:uncharacterized alkaline shock family protein YloU